MMEVNSGGMCECVNFDLEHVQYSVDTKLQLTTHILVVAVVFTASGQAFGIRCYGFVSTV
jgi:hypothetical protein